MRTGQASFQYHKSIYPLQNRKFCKINEKSNKMGYSDHDMAQNCIEIGEMYMLRDKMFVKLVDIIKIRINYRRIFY